MIKQIKEFLFGKKEPQGQVFNFNLPEKKKKPEKREIDKLWVMASRLKKRRRLAYPGQISRLNNAYRP